MNDDGKVACPLNEVVHRRVFAADIECRMCGNTLRADPVVAAAYRMQGRRGLQAVLGGDTRIWRDKNGRPCSTALEGEGRA